MGPTVWLVGRGGYPLATWLPPCLSFSHRHLKQLEGSKRWATDLTCVSRGAGQLLASEMGSPMRPLHSSGFNPRYLHRAISCKDIRDSNRGRKCLFLSGPLRAQTLILFYFQFSAPGNRPRMSANLHDAVTPLTPGAKQKRHPDIRRGTGPLQSLHGKGSSQTPALIGVTAPEQMLLESWGSAPLLDSC